LNFVCRTQNFTYTYWLLNDFSNQSEDTRLEDGPNFSDLTPFFIVQFYRMWSLARTQLSCHSKTDCTNIRI